MCEKCIIWSDFIDLQARLILRWSYMRANTNPMCKRICLDNIFGVIMFYCSNWLVKNIIEPRHVISNNVAF